MTDDSLVRSHALPNKTLLNHVYVIDEILGEGGFGITYGGYHKETGDHVAIKEYFPHNIAIRATRKGIFLLRPFPEKKTEEYKKGLKRFLGEARILNELQYLDSIVSVYDFFEENGTAYIVMEYIEGLTLGKYIEENGTLPFSELLHLMTPVIRSLSEIHSKGLIHRDISPDNLILGTDNKLHLIDFGASCKNTANTPGTVILKAGYAPPEQYLSGGRIGAWVDVYALCATMYFALTGKSPSEAIQRLEQDSLAPLAVPDDLLPWQRAAIEKGLQLRSANRFHDMEELYYALTTPPDTETQTTRMGSCLSPRSSWHIRRLYRPHRTPLYIGITTISLLLIIAFAIRANRIASPKTTSSESPASGSAAGVTVASTPTLVPEKTGASATESSLTSGNPDQAQTGLISVPDVTGLTLQKAKKLFRKLDPSIQVETIYTYDDTIASKHIITQSVAKETLFSKGHLPSILLTVSKGKKPDDPASPSPAATSGTSGNSSGKKRDSDYQVEPREDYQTIHID